MRRGLLLAALLTLLLSSCQLSTGAWVTPRFDSFNSGFNRAETRLGKQNAAGLELFFSASLGASDDHWPTPAVSNSKIYVPSRGKLSVFEEHGHSGCVGTPLVCPPAWTASLDNMEIHDSAVIAGGRVYVTGAGFLYETGRLFVFDALGIQNCSGAPKVCTPLWIADSGGFAPPLVTESAVYLTDHVDARVEVYDPAGQKNCAGFPTTCQPIWMTDIVAPSVLSVPALHDDRVFVTDRRGLRVFDAAGIENCSGSPTVCTPVWTADAYSDSSVAGAGSAPVVESGRVFMTWRDSGLQANRIAAFDAAGETNCVGSPKQCLPLWSTTFLGQHGYSQLAAAYGSVFASYRTGTNGNDARVVAFDQTGAGCSASPTTCPAQWESTGSTAAFRFPLVANGLLWVGEAGGYAAYDARGGDGCSGVPKRCVALATIDPNVSHPHGVVVNGKLVSVAHAPDTFGGLTATLRVYRLPG